MTAHYVSIAVSWTLLILVLLVVLAVFLVLRWMGRTRANFYDAVDAAVAEADRERANKDTVGAGVE